MVNKIKSFEQEDIKRVSLFQIRNLRKIISNSENLLNNGSKTSHMSEGSRSRQPINSTSSLQELKLANVIDRSDRCVKANDSVNTANISQSISIKTLNENVMIKMSSNDELDDDEEVEDEDDEDEDEPVMAGVSSLLSSSSNSTNNSPKASNDYNLSIESTSSPSSVYSSIKRQLKSSLSTSSSEQENNFVKQQSSSSHISTSSKSDSINIFDLTTKAVAANATTITNDEYLGNGKCEKLTDSSSNSFSDDLDLLNDMTHPSKDESIGNDTRNRFSDITVKRLESNDGCERNSKHEDEEDDMVHNDSIKFNILKLKNSTSESQLTLTTLSSPSLCNNSNQEVNGKGEQTLSFNSKHGMSMTSSSSANNSSYLACEVASLSSLTSDYSQFDFANEKNNHLTSNPTQSNAITQSNNIINQKPPAPSKSITSFFFSNGLFGNKKQKDSTAQQQQSKITSSIASKFFNLKGTSDVNSKTPIVKSNESEAIRSSSISVDVLVNACENMVLKSNHSYNNLALADYQLPSSVLIFENRPSNLPAKSQVEALKHKIEYEKMVEIAKKKEKKENEMKLKKYHQQIKKEDFMTNSLRIWNTEILTNWNELKDAKRTQQLWWHGLPPAIRGKVWKLAIGNELGLTSSTYYHYEKIAREKLELINKNQTDNNDQMKAGNLHESSVELIKLDVSRTFPQLSFFQKDGPYHDVLHSVLGAYACYNTKIGYVQGMSFLTAILLLNMNAPDSFIVLANLLNVRYLFACFCMDQTKMNQYFRVHQILFQNNIPKLYNHFEEQKVKPDLYLIDWIFTLFSKSLPLDVMSRVWDVFFRDKEEFLFKASLGILNLYKNELIQMDFIHIVQYLTKLPENISSTQLFKSIEQINTNIDDTYFTYENLINEIVN